MLTDLGMFSEAIQILIDLFHGERLPRNGNVGFRAVEEKSVCLVSLESLNSVTSLIAGETVSPTI